MSFAFRNGTAGNGTRGGQEPQLGTSPWDALGPSLVLLVLVIIPLFIIATIHVAYTLNHLYVAIAMIEEEDDPYDDLFWERNGGRFSDNPLTNISIEGDFTSGSVDDRHYLAEPNDDIPRPSPLTASLRCIDTRLRLYSGRLASFRGLFAFSMIVFFTILAKVLYSLATLTRSPESDKKWELSPSLNSELSTGLPALAISLATVQLSTRWVHIIVTPPTPWSPSRIIPHLGHLRSLKYLFMGWWTLLYLFLGAVKSFRANLPPFKDAFHATAMPVALQWLALNAARWINEQAKSAFGVSSVKLTMEPRRMWSTVMALVIGNGAYLILVVPIQAVLFRIQASMLPQVAKPVVSFRQIFGRLVEPRHIGGTGYLSMSGAWRSFSRQSWRRLMIVQVKVLCINTMLYFMLPAVWWVLRLVLLLNHKASEGTVDT
ncbi:ubiquitin conjugating [Colletotrichum truncatum]|uniref:Ubiquitin conjugating n=1 Tax=Colletotrichum truncatum TaxID=5467 RepID=A0ACC3ZHH2_COLTU|nr:ubiquitin conjugating [Colletotrichum truncatum]KAF6782283.1 ubiquitin conjugating [Colletotrichum truncatum]